jgi:hypothetical protein
MKMKIVGYDEQTGCHLCTPIVHDKVWPSDCPLQLPAGDTWRVDVMLCDQQYDSPEAYIGKTIEVDYVFPYILLAGTILSVEDT